MMDTSETFIKQCEKAVEIQERWKEFVGDFYSIGVGDFIGVVEWKTIRKKNFIWLPRQDQLQEMVHREVSNLVKILYGYFRDAFELGLRDLNPNRFYPTSMEQLWLAFVMKEKFGKVWNGEDWIKETVNGM